MIDIEPAAQRMADLVATTPDDQLLLATPCPEARVGDLIDHVGMFAERFLASARKDTGDRSVPPRPPHLDELGPDWRERIPRDLLAMAVAWGEPAAWEGVTVAGVIEMPAEVVGLVVLDELVVHGWDIATATGRPFAPPIAEVDAAMSFVSTFEAPRDGSLFGPVVPLADPQQPLDRLLALTGRDPGWRPPR